jgi:hypothetical protein
LGRAPVSEFFYEVDIGEFETRSRLIEAIWQIQDDLAVDFAVRGARINDRTVVEVPAGVTLAFGVARPPVFCTALFAAITRGSE